MFTLRFDMRAPDFGARATALYSAAPEMSAWAESRGCFAAVLCEHHGSEDGYLPSPIVLASAIAARTERLLLSLVVILPFYDPVRLAEDLAVLDIISEGRVSVVFGKNWLSAAGVRAVRPGHPPPRAACRREARPAPQAVVR